MKSKDAKKDRKKPGGRPPKHGAFSILVRRGELPERRTYLRRYLTTCREAMIRDLGPTEANLTAAEIILLDRAISKLGVVRCVEEFFAEKGIFMDGGQLAPVMSQDYIRYCESLRRDLLTLGIGRRAVDRVLTPLEIVKEYAAKDGKGS